MTKDNGKQQESKQINNIITKQQLKMTFLSHVLNEETVVAAVTFGGSEFQDVMVVGKSE